MKKVVVCTLFIGLSVFAHAATTVAVTNFSFPGPTGLVITNESGVPLTGFSIAVGTLDGSNAFLINGSALVVNTAPTFTLSVTNASVAPNDAAPGVIAADPFNTKNIYVAIGNTSVFSERTQTILFQAPSVWTLEDPVFGGTASVNIAGSTPVPGTFSLKTVNTTGIAPPFNAITNGITFVPEPSAALLGALGALGLLRRRRI